MIGLTLLLSLLSLSRESLAQPTLPTEPVVPTGQAGLGTAATAADPAAPATADSELQAAWEAFTRADYATALRRYEASISLGDPGRQATLGLGWTLQRLGQCDRASRLFLSLRKPDLPELAQSVKDGLAACPPPRPLGAVIQLAQSLYVYRSHPLRDLTSATSALLDLWLYERVNLGATYRFSHFTSASSQSSVWQQHDGFFRLGYAGKRVGVTAHYAFLIGALSNVVSGSNYAQTSHHFGATGRVTTYGDGTLAVAGSIYPSEFLFRTELAYRIPLGRGFSLRPAVAIQAASAALRGNGALVFAYDHPRFGVFAGGKYGNERRPANLDLGVVYNGPERIPFGAFGGASLRPGRGFSLVLSYAWDRLENEADGTLPAFQSNAHYLTFSASKEF